MRPPAFFARSELTRTLWTFRREFVVVGIFSMVANILMLTPTLYMLQVYDRVMHSRSELTLLAMSLLALFLFGIMAFAEWSRSRLLVRAGVRLDEQLNSRVFKASFDAALNQPGRNPVAAFSDLTNVRQFLTGNGIFAFFDAPWTPIYLGVMFMLHPWLGALAVVFSLMLASMTFLSGRLQRDAATDTMTAAADVGAYIQSKLRNGEVIEALGMLGQLRRRWKNRQTRYLQSAYQAASLARRIQSFSKFARYSQQSLMLGAGGYLVTQGDMTTGGMIAANVLMSRALAPIDMMSGTWQSFIAARRSFESLETLLRDNPERIAGIAHTPPAGNIDIHGLTATAPGRPTPILKGLEAHFPAGQLTAIIGPSGSGKSTLARTLVDIWPHWSGQILLDGEPLQNWERGELGPHLGYLPQDIEMLEGSIAENIARFGPVDPDKVIAAARRTGIHEMILRFPKGYDTPMGEAGNLLSGGQKQRIGLARALYGDPNLIVLDEPNANLDDVGEMALVEALRQLKAMGKTVFLITHRMNVINIVDRMLVLVDGSIQHLGPRDEIIAALQAAQA